MRKALIHEFPGVSELWKQTTGDKRIKIAILDGPVDLDHSCFHGSSLEQFPTLAGGGGGGPATEHGTHVASIIFGQHSSPLLGIAPSCKGLSIPIFRELSDGLKLQCSQLDLARAIFLSVEHGVNIINISGGQLYPTNEPEPLLAKAIKTCVEHNILIIASAGNEGCECLHIPASVSGVLAVGAMNMDGEPINSSNWGYIYQSQGLLAPGSNITGALSGGGVIERTGTSYATPIISGITALLLSIQLKRGEPTNPYTIRNALIKSAIPCESTLTTNLKRCLTGRLNIMGALHLIMGDKKMNEQISDQSNQNIPKYQNTINSAETETSLLSGIRKDHLSLSDSLNVDDLTPVLTDYSSNTQISPSHLTPASDCSCGAVKASTCSCATRKPTLVYALGTLGYDFGSEARRDSFRQLMNTSQNNPYQIADLSAYLDEYPYEAQSLIWTLNLDETPIFAIVPTGPFANVAFEILRNWLKQTLTDSIEMVSVPGVMSGEIELTSGIVPILIPSIRGMYSWDQPALLLAALGHKPTDKKELLLYERQAAGIKEFLDKIYYQYRNHGITSEDRALNYASTNAFQVAKIFEETTKGGFTFDDVNIKRSPICRSGSECYDVELIFFNPENTNIARRIFRYTIDVSDVMPVSVGEVRSWTSRI